jgi:hypothetical protein
VRKSCVEGDRMILRERETSICQQEVGDAVSRFKGKSTCFIFVNVSFNVSLKFAKEVKIREFDTHIFEA